MALTLLSLSRALPCMNRVQFAPLSSVPNFRRSGSRPASFSSTRLIATSVFQSPLVKTHFRQRTVIRHSTTSQLTLNCHKSGSKVALFCISSFNHYPPENNRDKYGNTPLHNAVKLGSYELVKSLLEKRANPNTSDHEGITPLQSAKARYNQAIVSLLEQFGAI